MEASEANILYEVGKSCLVNVNSCHICKTLHSSPKGGFHQLMKDAILWCIALWVIQIAHNEIGTCLT